MVTQTNSTPEQPHITSLERNSIHYELGGGIRDAVEHGPTALIYAPPSDTVPGAGVTDPEAAVQPAPETKEPKFLSAETAGPDWTLDEVTRNIGRRGVAEGFKILGHTRGPRPKYRD